MTLLIQAKNLTYSRGTKRLFENLNFTLNRGDKAGLVGFNGAGKSSLLGLLGGTQLPDDGEVVRRRDLTIATVEQFVPQALSKVTVLEAVCDRLDPQLRDSETYRAEALLQELGFTAEQRLLPIESLSGGQQNLVLFARARVLEVDVLLMDEPSNHMDMSALVVLKQYLRSTDGLTFVMVSHDRELLDDCCRQTTFLRDQRTYHFNLPYSQAKSALRDHDEQAQQRAQAEGKEIDRIRASAKRLAIWGKTYDNEDLARKAKTMAARAEKLEAQKTEVTRGNPLTLGVAQSELRAKRLVAFESLEVFVPDSQQRLLTCEHLVIRPGDRVALLGANGTGKSTTIEQMLKAQGRDDPAIRFNPNVVVGYFDQELRSFTGEQSRYQWLYERHQGSADDIKRALLAAGVAYDQFEQRVNTMSGGERARLVFVLLMLQQPNFLVLDEPTNHLDLDSREELESQLVETGATVLTTSHDKQFLANVCTRFWLIAAGRLVEVSDLEEAYARMTDGRASVASTTISQTSSAAEFSTEAALERLQELEDLLAADLARKPKFQKPARQAQWREEIAALWRRLDD